MLSFKRLLPGLLLAALTTACEPPALEPELTLNASPRSIDSAGQKSVLKATTYDSKGQPGTGIVRFTSAAGSLKAAMEVGLEGGEATADFTCAHNLDSTCTGPVRITAEWVVDGKTVTTITTITVQAPVVVVPDAGTTTLTLTSSRSQLGVGLGNAATLVATLQLDGAGIPDASVALATSLGQLRDLDGGVFTSPASTDGTGVVRALLVEDGNPGVASLTATSGNRTATAAVNIYRPDAGISITASPRTLTIGFNERSLVSVTHTLENRAVPGRPIGVETTAGTLVQADGGAFTGPGLTDTNGKLDVYLTDMGSPGVATITARDMSANVSASTTVTLAPPDAGVTVAPARNYLYLGINDAVDVAATLFANGNPTPNRTLNVAVNSLGRLDLPDGGAFNGTATTDAQGQVALVLRDTGTAGNAVITATDPSSGRTGTATVSVRNISTVAFESMTCGGMPCTVLGIRSSNFRTTGKLRFVVRDNQTPPQPVRGVTVTFSKALSGASGTDIAPPSAVTDVNGGAEVNVTTGIDVGSFTVTATVLQGIAATSPSFGVRGAKPTNEGFVLRCDKTTMSAYTSAQPGTALPITANCAVTVVDRAGNYVGLATDVSFRAEAGAIPGNAMTPEFSTGNSANEGRASVVFNTGGGSFPAVDVDPLPANAGQYPFQLVGEPSRLDGQLTRNPRDGLVTIIAWTRGEEWFNDLDGNGVQNGDEPFIDQGEPFIDTNDNDVFDGNDRGYNVDGNGVYDGPNGVWDAQAYIWTKTYVLYTDRSTISQFSARLPATLPFNVAKGSSAVVDVWMPDLNLNRIEAGSSVAFTRTATKGTVTGTWVNTGLDGVGFEFEPRVLTNQSGTGGCPTTTDRVCVYKTRFGGWNVGYIGFLTINGAVVTDMNPAQNESITVSTTTRGGAVPSAAVIGIIQ